jgi:hypothetical protein
MAHHVSFMRLKSGRLESENYERKHTCVERKSTYTTVDKLIVHNCCNTKKSRTEKSSTRPDVRTLDVLKCISAATVVPLTTIQRRPVLGKSQLPRPWASPVVTKLLYVGCTLLHLTADAIFRIQTAASVALKHPDRTRRRSQESTVIRE